MSEQTIRNKRQNGNPYLTIFREWEKVAHAVVATPPAVYRKDGLILLSQKVAGHRFRESIILRIHD